MNGEVKSYRLNDPMSWIEFKSMPDDLKVVYIQELRKKYNVPDRYIYQMFGIGKDTLIKEMKRLNLILGDRGRGRRAWDKEGFLSWANGVDAHAPVPEEEPAEEPIQEPVIFSEEPEAYVEDDLPFEEPDPVRDELHMAVCADRDVLKIRIDELRKRNEELLKINEELKAHHENDRQVINQLRFRCADNENKAQILEAQMDVVRLIFGGKNNG